MEGIVKKFVESPGVEGLENLSKQELLAIGEHYNINLGDLRKSLEHIKGTLKTGLASLGVLEREEQADGGLASASNILTFEQQKELLLLRLQFEKEKEERKGRTEMETEREKIKFEFERERMKYEIEKQKLELVRDGKMDLDYGSRSRGAGKSRLDELDDLKLVPSFNEEDPETFFLCFERLAETRGWSESASVLMLQRVLVGKARQAYVALSSVDGARYEEVKGAVLKAYELVPEAYRQRFRGGKRGERTHLEFVRELVLNFDNWCSAAGVKTKEDMRELILLEQFKNSVADRIADYVNERGVRTIAEAAALADDYYLTHSGTRISGGLGFRERSGARGWSAPEVEFGNGRFREADKICNYCHKRGHWKNDCYALKLRSRQAGGGSNPSPVMCAAVVGAPQEAEVPSGLKSYLPFITEGCVSLVGGGEQVRIKILRDTGAVDSFILAAALPFSDKSSLGSCIPVVGMGMCVLEVPQHKIMLQCDFFQGEVVVGVRPVLPVEGVTMILGNDIAGSRVWGELPPPVEVTGSPGLCSKHEEEIHQAALGVCVVTRSRQLKTVGPESGVPGQDFAVPVVPWAISQADLLREQEADSSLQELRDGVCPALEVRNRLCCYLIQNGVLLRKWTPQLENFVGDSVYQVVVPVRFRSLVLQIAHDQGGHLGVRKTYDRVLRYFFWPGLKKAVTAYCKSCHTCQMTSKPNQILQPAPLNPIPAIGQPFEHVLIDCVGPLPPARSGASYLLTVMCQSTRYPAAYPLRSITTKSVVRALSQFISIFGIPRIVQSDKGSNFCSHLFDQVLQQLRIRHNFSSAYHAQSQGALERFHQTLKSMLRAFCVQMKEDWEEALPWLLLAAREVVQESTGFSPNDLVFSHRVRGPLALLQDGWRDMEPPSNLIDFVNGFRHRLYLAQETAKRRLVGVQGKMKQHYDRRAVQKEFLPGDQVLALLPLVTSPFQAKFSGPYTVLEKLSELNYLISTPERRSKTQLCHVNLLKSYFAREASGMALATTRPQCVAAHAPVVAALEDGELLEPDQAVVSGRLQNSASLAQLETTLHYLESSKRAQLVQVIREFQDLFGDTPSCTSLIKHDIDVGEALPIRQRFYRVHPEKRKLLEAEVGYMLDNKIASPSDSSWASPCILVPKSDNSARFCTDFRKVNAVTKSDSFPLPRMEDCVDQVGGANYVTKLDLLKGYWQVPLTERAKQIASFITSSGLYSYNVMPFGLRNAPATFQRLMNLVVRGLDGCAVYLDDLVVFSDTWEDHVSRLRAVFVRLSEAGLTVNLAKCEFAKATVVYLGRVVGQGSVRPVRAQVEAIDSFPPPQTKKELMRFLGMVGYYRCFCPNFSSVVSPLTDLLKAGRKYVWSLLCQKAFERVKGLITNSPVLAAPQWDREFQLEVDASLVGAGAVLLQADRLGVNRPVCFFSRKFNRHQLNYSVIEKETLALIWALQHFQVYVGSGPVVVFSDHNPLTFLSTLQAPSQRLVRWALFLQSYTLEIRHVRGTDNVVADALSRAPLGGTSVLEPSDGLRRRGCALYSSTAQ